MTCETSRMLVGNEPFPRCASTGPSTTVGKSEILKVGHESSSTWQQSDHDPLFVGTDNIFSGMCVNGNLLSKGVIYNFPGYHRWERLESTTVAEQAYRQTCLLSYFHLSTLEKKGVQVRSLSERLAMIG